MKKLLQFIIKSLLGVFFGSLIISCLEQDLQNSEQVEQDQIQAYIDGKGFTDIGYGTYLKFYNRDNITLRDSNVVTGDAFVINYDGAYIDETLWETTDSAKGGVLFPQRYWIYGPVQFRAGQLNMVGFDTAINYFSSGDTGTIVIPSKSAWGDYARVFHVGMKEVIKNDTLHEEEKIIHFLETNNFNPENVLYGDVYWRNPDNPSFTLSDTSLYGDSPTMSFNLIGRYAETYYSSGIGRVFYPLIGESLRLDRKIGANAIFPIRPAIDSALIRMNVGDIIEIAGDSDIGWGKNGYRHPNLDVIVIPEYMPIHYRIELLDAVE